MYILADIARGEAERPPTKDCDNELRVDNKYLHNFDILTPLHERTGGYQILKTMSEEDYYH